MCLEGVFYCKLLGYSRCSINVSGIAPFLLAKHVWSRGDLTGKRPVGKWVWDGTFLEGHVHISFVKALRRLPRKESD